MEAALGYDDAVGVGVEPRARAKGHACKANVAGGLTAMKSFFALSRMRRQRLHPDVAGGELEHVAHAAVHDEPRPAVFDRELSEQPADKRAPERPAPVDDEHAPRAGGLESGAHERVVLEDFQGGHGAEEGAALSEVGEDRLADLHVGVGVAEVGRRRTARVGCGGWALYGHGPHRNLAARRPNSC